MKKNFPLFLILLFSFSCQSGPKIVEDMPEAPIKAGPPVMETPPENGQTVEDAQGQPEDVGPNKDLSSLRALENSAISGDYAAALVEFENLTEEERSGEETALLYSSLLISAGEFGEAEAELNKLREKDPDNTEALFNLAIIEGINGDMSGQLGLLKEIIEKEPDNSMAQAAIGDIYLATRRYKQAQNYFQAGLDADPDNSYALLGMGRTLLVDGNPEGALVYLNEAMERSEDDALIFASRAKAKTELGDYQGAEKDYTKAIDLMPDFYWFYMDRGILRQLMTSDTQSALDDFDKAIELNPDYFWAYLHRAQVLDLLDKYTEAISDYEKVLEYKDDYYYAYVPMAILYFFVEEWDKSSYLFQKAYEIEEDPGFALMAGLCGLRGNNPANAKTYISNFIARQDRDLGFYHVGRAFIENGYDNYALHVISRLSDKTEMSRCLFYMAEYYQDKRSDNLALTYFEEVVEKGIFSIFEYRLTEFELNKKEEL